jgi:rod shape-determining protein MreD
MRWLAFFILVYLTLALQISLAPNIPVYGAMPNFGLLAALFIALYAPRDSALLGCFFLGFMQDLVSQQPLGLFAFSYGLVAVVVVTLQHSVDRGHPLTHFSLAMVAGCIVAGVLLFHSLVRPAAPHVMDGKNVLPPIRISTTIVLETVLYTAILAPLVLWLLQRTRTVFGFQHSRKRW